MEKEIKIGYKGTNSKMVCREQQYEIGKEYFVSSELGRVIEIESVDKKPEKDTNLRVCSDKGIHYCDKLEQCFTHYKNNGKSRFFKVEILGRFNIDSDNEKGTTTHIKFLEEIPKEELEKIEREKLEIKTEEVMGFDTVRTLQKKYPQTIIGGSLALYLHGVRLERYKNGGDLDITVPYYTLFETKGDDLLIEENEGEDRPSGSDFDETLIINGQSADIRVDAKQRYEYIEYKEFKYKVCPLHVIIGAKAKYAQTRNGDKHRLDLREMILNK